MSPSSVSGILRETLSAICQAMQNTYLPEPTSETWESNAQRFFKRWNFPNACGSVDGKHVRIKAPSCSGSLYFNYKGYFSIVLLAIADADFKFSAVDIGAYGSESDGGIFAKSSMGKKLISGNFGIPPSKSIIENQIKLPHVILGDDAFSLKTFLMRPYKGGDMLERAFNYRLSRARMTVENAFGILAARWRIFNTPIECDISLTKLIVQATTILHNFLIIKNDLNSITVDRTDKEGNIIRGNWRTTTNNDTGMIGGQRQGSNNYAKTAAEVRDHFRDYFTSEHGKVSWQDAHIANGH